MTVDAMMAAIAARSRGRFSIDGAVDKSMLTQDSYLESRVCRLRRVAENAGWRTILVAAMPFTVEAVQAAYRWAAEVRERLPEREAADLYLILMVEGIPSEEAARIETDDRFCRKFVMQSSESDGQLLDRTFLATIVSQDVGETIGDPLQAALAAMAKDHPWTGAHLTAWRTKLLSGYSGAELARELASVRSDTDTTP